MGAEDSRPTTGYVRSAHKHTKDKYMMTIEEKHREIWTLIEKARVGMLTTEDGGDLRARPMTVVQKGYEGTLWFLTLRSSEKVFETLREQRVCVTFAHPDDRSFVSLSGIATLSSDQKRIDELWSKGVDLWFPKDRDNDQVVLLKIDVYKGESWTVKEGGIKKMFEVAKAAITGSTPDIGQNDKFEEPRD